MGSPISQPHDDPALEQLQSMLAPATQGAEKTEAKPTDKQQAIDSAGEWLQLTNASRDLSSLASLLDPTEAAPASVGDTGAPAEATAAGSAQAAGEVGEVTEEPTPEEEAAAQNAAAQAEKALASAVKNNVPENLERCDALIKESEETITPLHEKYPEAPSITTAYNTITAAREAFDQIDPLIVRNPEVSAGAAASAQRTISEDRVSMLFGDLDNDIAETIMNGLRQMIQNFDEETPMSEQALQRTAAELDTISQNLGPEQAAAGELQKMKEALQAGTKGAALADALSTIGAAALGGGGTLGIKAALSSILIAGFGPSASSLTAGYEGYRSINDAMAKGNRDTQQVLGRTTSAFLRERLPSTRTDSRTNTPSARVANAIVGNSRTIGDLFANVGAAQTMAEVLLSTPNANTEEIRAKLTSAVTKAPQTGFPYVQFSEGALQNLADAVLQARADAERAAAGSKEAEFSSAPTFIQQVLVNIGSLFAGYLQ